MALYTFKCLSCGKDVELIISLSEYDPKEERHCEEVMLDGSTCGGKLERTLNANRGVVLGRFRADNGYGG